MLFLLAICMNFMCQQDLQPVAQAFFKTTNKQNVVKPVVNLSSFHDICSEAHKRNWFYQ